MEPKISLVCRLFREGKSPTEIATLCNIPYNRAYRILRRNGLLRPVPNNRSPRPPKHDLTDKEFNYLTVVKMAITDKSVDGTWRCICRCKCGREIDSDISSLRRGLRKTCGNENCPYHQQTCSQCQTGKNSKSFAGHQEIHGSKWSGIRCGALRRHLEFKITIEEAWNLYEAQGKKCALTGLPIGFGKRYVDGNTASLDRINSEEGYILNNVQWVHKDVNKMKMDLSSERFLELCKLIVATHL